jgi:protein-S-isoprenylcysteine O-methyltransferase Ste14
MESAGEVIMTLIPAFEIGVWNAWTFMLVFLVFSFVPLDLPILKYTNKAKYENMKAIYRKSGATVPLNKTERKISISWMPIMLLLLIYSIFLPLQLGTVWFYTGLTIFIVGLIMLEIAGRNYTTTPLDEPVIKGLYRYSRHPVYLSFFLMFIGTAIASASWLFLLLTIVFLILMNILVVPEERFCLEEYGDTYREYMSRTPRWIGIPRSSSNSQA